MRDDDFEKYEMQLKQFVVGRHSDLAGKTIGNSGIRAHFHCLIVGVEFSGDNLLRTPEVNMVLGAGDIVWVVGEERNLNKLFLAEVEAEKNRVAEEK